MDLANGTAQGSANEVSGGIIPIAVLTTARRIAETSANAVKGSVTKAITAVKQNSLDKHKAGRRQNVADNNAIIATGVLAKLTATPIAGRHFSHPVPVLGSGREGVSKISIANNVKVAVLAKLGYVCVSIGVVSDAAANNGKQKRLGILERSILLKP